MEDCVKHPPPLPQHGRVWFQRGEGVGSARRSSPACRRPDRPADSPPSSCGHTGTQPGTPCIIVCTPDPVNEIKLFNYMTLMLHSGSNGQNGSLWFHHYLWSPNFWGINDQ